MAERATSADVIVVGGGITGTSIAWRLAESGRRVLLLERRGICAGASGRNAGMTGAGSSMHAASRAGRAVYAITMANLNLMRNLHEELGRTFSLLLPGSLDIITTEAQYEHLKHAVTIEQDAGIEIELLDSIDTRSIMPALSPAILGAAFAEDRGHFWPFALVTAIADAAVRHSAELRVGARVQRLLRDGDRVFGVEVDGLPLLAEHVILATNAWTPALLPELPPGAVVPARGQIMVTQPLPPLMPCPFGTNFDKEYGRQTPTGQVLMGGFRRDDENEGLGSYLEEVTPAVQAGLASSLVDLFPELRGKARVARSWAGIMGFTADGLPLIGPLAPSRGLWVAAGFNGAGFSWGPITGKIMTRLINGQDPGFDLEPFQPDRFLHGGVAWENPFTAGEKNNPHQAQSLTGA